MSNGTSTSSTSTVPYITPAPTAQMSPEQFLQQQMAQQANTTGLTQMAPAVPGVQVPRPAPFQERPMQATGPVGPGQGPWKRQVEQQNFVAGVQNMAGKITQQIQERKSRQQQQVFDHFAGANKGLNDAQGQMQSAQQQIEQAKAALQADPNNAQARQTIIQATQQLQQAQQAIQQNKTIIDDIANDPKKAKLLSKGFGIDDKNAGTPERQQAIQSIKKSTGVGDKAAGILSRLPQTQQLSPQAQAQQMARQAGIVGAPATQGQVLAAATKEKQLEQAKQIDSEKRRAAFVQQLPKLEASGYSFEKDENGRPKFDGDGFPQVHVMSQEERDKNPALAAKNQQMQAAIELQKAKTAALTDPNNIKNKIGMLNAEANMKRANAALTGNVSDAREIARDIEKGHSPPSTAGLYRLAGSVRAQLARDNFDLATAENDWKAIQKHIATLNGPQQERLRQAITFTYDSLDVIDNLYSDWTKTGLPSGFKDYNRSALEAAAKLPGHAGSVASQLQNQINDLTSELGTVYKGGNASTDETLRLASGNLKAEWNSETFHDSMGTLRKNLQLRKNSIDFSQPAGVSAGSPYVPAGEKGGAAGGASGPASDDELLKMLDTTNP
jgi:hypothetical protein